MRQSEWFSREELFITDVVLGKHKRDTLPNHGRKYNGKREIDESIKFAEFIKSDFYKQVDANLRSDNVGVDEWRALAED